MDSIYLEVGIGLVVVFFVLATIADLINEVVSRTLNTRAKTLWAAMTGLLSTASEQNRPDIGVELIFQSVLPSWMGGVDHRPRVADHALSSADRVAMIDAISRARAGAGDGREPVDTEHQKRIEAAFQADDDISTLLKFERFIDTANDGQLITLTKRLLEVGDIKVDTVEFYPPLQSARVRADLTAEFYGVDEAEAFNLETPSAEELADWLARLPTERQLELLAKTTTSGKFLNSAARTASLLATTSIGGLDYIRHPGRRTKVWWLEGKAFGSAIWELAKENAPIDAYGGPVGVDSVAMIENLATEWEGTPLGDYLASSGVEHAEDVDHFIESVGEWFNGQMDRLSLTYRRNVRWVLAAIGLGLAFIFNVNALGLSTDLVGDAQARVALSAYADATVAQACGADGVTCDLSNVSTDLQTELKNLSKFEGEGVPILSNPFAGDTWSERDWSPSAMFGMLVTAAAVSFGGSFWFDFLKYLTGVRRKV